MFYTVMMSAVQFGCHCPKSFSLLYRFPALVSSLALFFTLSFHLLSASLPLCSEKGSIWTSTLFFDCFFSQPPKSPFSLSLLTFSSPHHTFQLSSFSLTPTLTCPYFALLIYFAVLGHVHTNYTLSAVWLLSFSSSML